MKAAYVAQKPSECWDWISARDLHRIAVQAFKRAKANCFPPRGQRWLEAGTPWSSPADFAEGLSRLLVLHLQAEAHGAGIPGNEYAPGQLSAWYGDAIDGAANPGAGRSPADRGHGCPASPAGGPGRDTLAALAAVPTGDALPCSVENAP